MNLVDALAAWRADRSVANAERVDRASEAMAIDRPPKRGVHRWWIARARTYDPIVAATLLAHVLHHAQGENVSWRSILKRETPLVDRLRPVLAPTEVGAAWQNLIHRIDLMLAWPDDPRVARRLARLLHEPPLALRRGMKMTRSPVEEGHFLGLYVRAAIVDRVLAIGDPRAIEQAAWLWQRYDKDTRDQIRATAEALPMTPDRPDDLADLWATVVEEPDDLARRLVLADALIERGDPRGEMIAMQCAPLLAIERARAAGEKFDPSGMFGHSAERISKLIHDNWHRWLGDVAYVAGRSSRFRGGLLWEVSLGSPVTPAWAWERTPRHRELCAVHELVQSMFCTPEQYVAFAGELRRKPQWISIDERHLPYLRPNRIPATGVRCPFRVAREIVALGPGLEYLSIERPVDEELPQILELAPRLAHLKKLTVAVFWRDAIRPLLDRLEQVPNVQVQPY